MTVRARNGQAWVNVRGTVRSGNRLVLAQPDKPVEVVVVAIYCADGMIVARYTYNAWGKILHAEGRLAKVNPC